VPDSNPIFSPGIVPYLESLVRPRHAVLAAMEDRARETGFPIVGPQVGTFLQILVRAAGVREIFELGSGFGYSALWMALALPPEGRITTTESSEDNVALARGYFREADLENKVEMLTGDGLETLRERENTYDLIFCDLDKQQYPETIPVVLERLRRGGLFVTDNVLWEGRVREIEPDETTRAILLFNRTLHKTEEFLTSFLPLRDGISISLKR
jgi:caffeoyl-CoA O-methyltransferase